MPLREGQNCRKHIVPPGQCESHKGTHCEQGRHCCVAHRVVNCAETWQQVGQLGCGHEIVEDGHAYDEGGAGEGTGFKAGNILCDEGRIALAVQSYKAEL